MRRVGKGYVHRANLQGAAGALFLQVAAARAKPSREPFNSATLPALEARKRWCRDLNLRAWLSDRRA